MDDYSIEKKIIDRILSLPQFHILSIFIVYAGMNMLEPEVPGDSLINNLLDNTFIGSVVGFFTEVDTSPNYQLIALVDKIKQNTQLYVVLMAVLVLIETIGLIGRKFNKYIVESISIICSIAPIIAFMKLLDFAEYILKQSKVYGIFDSFGGVIDFTSFYRIFFVLMFIALPITHTLSHRALSVYYAPTSNNTVSIRTKLIMLVSIVGFLSFIWKVLLNPKIEEDLNVNNNSVENVRDSMIKEEREDDKNKNNCFETTPQAINKINSENSKSQLSDIEKEKEIIFVDEIWAYYWDKKNQSPYDLCFYKQNIDTGDTTKISIPIELGLSSINDIFLRDDSTFLIIGNNGWNSYMNSDYVISFNTEKDTYSLVLSSKEIIKMDNYLEVTNLDMITMGEFVYQNVYDTYKEYYDFYGNRIEGNTIKGKGNIGKYRIEMAFHTLEGGIKGWYKYEGHTNYMTIKGEMKDNGDFTFSEYSEKGERFGTFTGNADFNRQKLSGVWINGETQLDFEIQGEEKDGTNMNNEYQSELKDLIIYWNELHTNQLISSTSLESMYAPEVLFYGQTLSSKDCVSRIIQTMKKYDSFSQSLEGDIQYTRMDNNTVRCDFVKRVETNGKYANYSAYLVFGKEDNDWSIITESDTQTDAYFERNK